MDLLHLRINLKSHSIRVQISNRRIFWAFHDVLRTFESLIFNFEFSIIITLEVL